ncbi:MAG: coproporphyrinogen dehydrogenase HemZ [Clostridia bacterium]|nr:coproporphyrinogen dehydrogenase HemZ [Clostridia bacterium]
MIKLYTNCPEYENDIMEELRQASPPQTIEVMRRYSPPFAEGDIAVKLTLLEKEGVWLSRASISMRKDGRVFWRNYTHKAEIKGSTPIEIKRYQKRCVKIAAFRLMRKVFDMNAPWGSLTGIRPTRLLRELELSLGKDEAGRMMLKDFDVTKEKYELCSLILSVQDEMPKPQKGDVGIYIGIPYCKTRCLYCSFPSGVRTDKTDMRAYIDALKLDISLGANILFETGHRVRSMYIGGGTPTVLTASELDEVLSHALTAYGGFGLELTVEAGRPDTIDKDKLMILKKHNATRISINPQTMNDTTLQLIGRSHSADQIYTTFSLARELGFDNINMDVIAGLPGEDVSSMENTLKRLIGLAPESITVHTLAIKRSSPLKLKLLEYSVDMPPDEVVVDMTELAGVYTGKLNMRPYYMYRQKYMRGNLENIGYSKPGYECIYNVDMMEEQTSIMSHGAGSMTKALFDRECRVERIPNPKEILVYINKIERIAEKKKQLFESSWKNS